MVVWKSHGTSPNDDQIEWMLERLEKAGTQRFGKGNGRIDRTMRQVPEHFHAHLRDAQWLSRRWTEKPSKYSGVGGQRVLLT